MSGDIINLSRRDVLRLGLFTGAGLVLGVSLPGLPGVAHALPQDDPIAILNAFVRVGTDGTVTIIANHSEMGQGAYTSTAMLVAEELEPDWTTVRIEAAPVDPVYNHPGFGMQATGGSTSTWSEWDRLRQAGAAAREMLIAAAATQWGVEPGGCRAEGGVVHHNESGKTLAFGDLAEAAGKLEPPTDVPLKPPADWHTIGKPTARLDTKAKTDGTAVFGIDVTLPGMLVALLERPPVFGATLKRFDDTAAKAIPGVKHVVAIPHGVAVVAEGFWAAKKGREALITEWDDGPLGALDTATQGAEYRALLKETGKVARTEGDAAAALPDSATQLDAEYDLPYLSHSAMEPLNAVADVRADGCDVYVGTQFQTLDFFAAVGITGLRPDQVKLHTTYLGGGFGRRGVMDSHFVREAVLLSKQFGVPVKVIWTREDDTRGGFYRPRSHHAIRGGLDAAGAPTAWTHHVACQSFAIGTPLEQFMVVNGLDRVTVEGAADIPYAIPNLHVEWHRAPNGVPTHWWRSVGHSHNAFVVESFIDELAHAAGADPVEFRRGLLAKHPRQLALLNLVADKAGWGSALPKGRARGVALHESFGSLVAHVAEVSIGDGGRPRVHKVTAAVDCGVVVNPRGIMVQIESAIAYGLSAALYGQITFAKGRVQQGNFHEYPVLRTNEMPEVDVHLAPNGGKIGGVGEPGLPPIAPAVTNAMFMLTGERIRRLPIMPPEAR